LELLQAYAWECKLESKLVDMLQFPDQQDDLASSKPKEVLEEEVEPSEFNLVTVLTSELAVQVILFHHFHDCTTPQIFHLIFTLLEK